MSKGGKNGRGAEKHARRHVRRSHTVRHRAEPSGNVEEVAAQLAPLEEQTAARASEAGANNNGGAIVVDTGVLKLPAGLVEEKQQQRLMLGVEPVVFFIIVFAVVFILFIAWQISQMPPPSGG
ncbi:MAG: hypothetical protein ACJ741_13800 [Pyrinomonadaceae bacterium]